MTSSLNIAICGCGPAGLTAALLLHRAGHRVQLFDQFDTPRPLGSGLLLQPTGLGVLAELNLLEPIVQLGAKIDRLHGVVSATGRVALDVKYSAMGAGWRALGIHRAVLFDTLHSAVVAQRIPLVNAMRINRVKLVDGKISLLGEHDKNLGTFDMVVNALGANSPLSANVARRTVLNYGALWTTVPLSDESMRLGLQGNVLTQRYQRASRMAGVLPIGRLAVGQPLQAAFFWSMRRDHLPAWRSSPLEAWKQDVAELWPNAMRLLERVTEHEQLTFAQYDHFTAAVPYAERIVHIGDAAHATSPQLGQGANMALLDALALAHAIQLNSDVAMALAAYARMRRWHVRLFQYASAIFTPFYQSDSHVLPWLRDWITAPLSRLPIGDLVVARLVSGMTNSPLADTKFLPVRLGTDAVV